MKNHQIKNRRSLLSVALFGLLGASLSHGITIPDGPLIVGSGEPPNLMLILDTSGSMENIAVDVPYDSTQTYGPCTDNSPLSVGSGSGWRYSKNVYLLKVVSGEGKINVNNTGSNNSWNAASYCFDADQDYYAFLTTNTSATTTSSTYAPPYSGNYLNWYFSNSTQTGAATTAEFGVGATRKVGTNTRLITMQNVMEELFNDTFSNINVGIASFAAADSNHGQIEKGLLPIPDEASKNCSTSGSNCNTLINTVNSLTATGSTPLASTLAQVGRYYVQGKDVELATRAFPNIDDDEDAYDVFADEPGYAATAVEPDNLNPAIANECQSNFVLAMTDGEPTTDSAYSDFLAYWDDNTRSDNDLADVAAALYDLDLRPDEHPDEDLALEGDQNVSTYVVGFELTIPLLDATALAGGTTESYTATDSDSLATAFSNIFNNIQAQVGSFAAVSFSSSQLDTGTSLFQAIYNTGDWTGTLTAYPLDSSGVIGSETWEAGALLDAQTYTNRNIFTFNGTAGVKEGVVFEWDNLSVTQKADLYRSIDLDADGNSTNDSDDAQTLLAYIYGDTSNEGDSSASNYRSRGSRLGDIVNSTPLHIGAPEMNWPEYDIDDSTTHMFGTEALPYSDYVSSAASRTPVVYVGSNDGMLHGFDASSTNTAGDEVFAYIPNAVFSDGDNSGLHYLAEQDYNHKFYVDLTPVASDVFIDRSHDQSGSDAWRTIVIGGLRAGGRGLFALDVSDPSEFSNNNDTAADAAAANIVLWEFTNADDSDLGYTYSQPSVAMMANGKWAVIFGNGYESDGGIAKLFILYIEEGVDGTWTLTDDYVKLTTGIGTDNGLSTPQLADIDGDSVVDLIYAGDLKGNMWAFNVSSSTAGDWSSTANIRKVFTAGAAGNVQPITTPPMLAANPHAGASPTAAAPNVLVMFGTGKYLESSDNSSTEKMAFYSVWDTGVDNGLTTSDLEPRIPITDDDIRTVSGDAVDWTTQKGWYMDLANVTETTDDDGNTTQSTPALEGERVVTSPLLRRSVLFYNTAIIEDPESDTCSPSGSGWLMSVAYDTGLAPTFAVFDANGDGDIDSDDIGFSGSKFTHGIPSRSGILGDKQYTPGTDGEVDSREVNIGAGNNEGRFTWLELLRD